MSVMDNYQKARARMLIKHMFFGTIVLSTEFIPDETIETLQTDMKRVWYNPKFMNDLDVEVCIFALAHEIYHIILMHGLRRGDRNPELWNIAADYAINLQLKKNGFKLWDKCYGAQPDAVKFDNMTAEQIYEVLKKNPPPTGGGGGAGGTLPGGFGRDLREASSDPAERAAIERSIKQKITQAATMARAAGKMPAGMDLIVDGIINPPLPWYAMLRDYMTRTVNEVENWTRRNRRFTTMLPTRHNLGMGPVCLIGDTSGSILGDKIFAQIGAELDEMREMAKPEKIVAVWADHAECSHEETFLPGDPIDLHPRGGGGTDMRLPLKYVRKYEPEIVVIVTDCETPWPSSPTPFPLIVLSTNERGKSPSWAQRINIR